MTSSTHTAIGLDIGSNTISCCKLKEGPNHFTVIQDISLPVRLSENLVPNGPLKNSAIVRGLTALEKIHSEFDMDKFPVKAAATAVLRMTSTPERFLQPAQELIGAPIQVIDGEAEGRYTSNGAILGLPQKKNWIMLDIGGQSTEISPLQKNGEWAPISLPLGVVGATERFITSPIPTKNQIEGMRKNIRHILQANISPDTQGELVCVGGTPTTLSMLEQQIHKWDRNIVHGHVISSDACNRWLERMIAITAQERIEKYGMRPLRADVFPAGICALLEVMNYLELDSFTVSANGLRVGLALSLLRSVQ